MTAPTNTRMTAAERSAAAGLTLTCSSCGATNELTDALTGEVRAELTREFEEIRRRDQDAIEAEVRHNMGMEIEDLHAQIRERDQQVNIFRTQELDLRKRERTLTEKIAEVGIEVERRLATERGELQQQAEQRAEERYGLQLADKDKQLQRLSASLQEAQRRAVQGSQELQGTVQQDALEEELASAFPTDELSQVPRGTRGADVLQTVRVRALRCGAILWESKRAKEWNHAWLAKIKEDQRRCGAGAAAIVTACLPPGAARIDRRDDVWITDLASAPLLALVLREGLVALAQQQARIAGKTDLQGEVYDYITSARFIEHVKAAVESMTTMHDQLDAERAAHERLWSKRAKEIDRAEVHIARMIGDIEGLGASIPSIPARLQLAAGA